MERANGAAKDNLAQKVWATMQRHQMVKPGDKILVAFSGGIDSVVLLDILFKLAPRANFELQVGHVHHGLRVAARADAAFARQVAARYNLPVAVSRIDVPQALKPGDSVQAVARKLRYAALRGQAKAGDAQRIAVAHHQDDQVETVLMRFLTGTGTDGLAGMAPVRADVIRPLIDVPLARLRQYAHEHGLPWREDESNLDQGYLRNRVRLKLLPFLQEHFNPNIKEAILRLSQIARDEAQWAEEMAGYLTPQVRLDTPLFGTLPLVVFALPMLQAAPVALQRRLLRTGLWRAGGRRSGWQEVEKVRRLLSPPAATAANAFDLTDGVRARRHGSQLYLYSRDWARGPDYEATLKVPGSCFVAPACIKLSGQWSGPGEYTGVSQQPVVQSGGRQAVWQAVVRVDDGSTGSNLTVRNPRPGDRLALVSGKTVSLREYMRQQAVPLPLRRLLPVVAWGQRLLAVPGYYPPDLGEPGAVQKGARRPASPAGTSAQNPPGPSQQFLHLSAWPQGYEPNS